MKSAERLSQTLGSNIIESMGGRRTGSEPGSAPQFPTGVVHGGPGAEKYRGAARLKDAFAIELERLAPDPEQPRKLFEPETLKQLAESLKTRGQLQPVRVRYEESSNRWIIITGERRYRAAQMAGLPNLMCVEAKGNPTTEDLLEDQLVENCVREDLKPIEQAKAFQALIAKLGCSYRQLADSLNISHQAVVRALALLDLPEDVQEKVDAGTIAASAAAEVARLDDEMAQRELVKKLETGSLTRDAVSKVVREKTAKATNAKGRGVAKSKPRPPIDDRPRRAANGVKIRVEATPKHSIDQVVLALRELADRLAQEAQSEQQAA